MMTWKDREEKVQNKHTLAGRIRGVAALLIAVGFFMTVMGSVLMQNYRERILEAESRGTENYLNRLNQTFLLINSNLRSALANSMEIRNLEEAGANLSEDDVGSVVQYNNAVNDIYELFQSMEYTYGSEYSFFYYSQERQKMIEWGSMEYLRRISFQNIIHEKIREGSLSYTKAGKWFKYGDYICTIFKGENGIIGSYILLDEFVMNMFSMAPAAYDRIEIYDEMNGLSYYYSLSEQGTIICGENSAAKDETGKYYTLSNTSFQCRFVLARTAFENIVMLPMLFVLVVLIWLVVVLLVLQYIKRNILKHVNKFYDNLLKIKDTNAFQEEGGVAEFAEAGKVLNQLGHEIRSLKIDIYEQQIQKQKVELDYAHLQIRPHFYINCLSVIHSMAQFGGTGEIQKLTVLVSVYLRSLLKDGTVPVPIGSELEFVENYVRMLECMDDAHYTCRVDIQDCLKPVLVPPLLIQTLVENSIKHNSDINGLQINIDIYKIEENGGRYCDIRITDNGTGFASNTLEQLNAGTNEAGTADGYHIGISNAIARLKLLYGGKAEISFCNRKENRGAVVEIVIPMGEEDNEHSVGG